MHIKWRTALHLAGAILLRLQTLTQTGIPVFIPAFSTMVPRGDNVLQMPQLLNQPIIFKPGLMKNGTALKKLLLPELIPAKASLKTGMEHIQDILCGNLWTLQLMHKTISRQFHGGI